MKYIVPLPSVSDKTMSMIRNIYNSGLRRRIFRYQDGIKITNHFIDNTNDFDLIMENVVKPVGINPDDVGNLWNEMDNEYQCNGINFNVMCGGDFLKPHRDYNPTKLNILISGKTMYRIHYLGEDQSESYDWEYPALCDVSKKHYVDDMAHGAPERVMLQVFIKKSFDYYKNIINLNPNW